MHMHPEIWCTRNNKHTHSSLARKLEQSSNLFQQSIFILFIFMPHCFRPISRIFLRWIYWAASSQTDLLLYFPSTGVRSEILFIAFIEVARGKKHLNGNLGRKSTKWLWLLQLLHFFFRRTAKNMKRITGPFFLSIEPWGGCVHWYLLCGWNRWKKQYALARPMTTLAKHIFYSRCSIISFLSILFFSFNLHSDCFF